MLIPKSAAGRIALAAIAVTALMCALNSMAFWFDRGIDR